MDRRPLGIQPNHTTRVAKAAEQSAAAFRFAARAASRRNALFGGRKKKRTAARGGLPPAREENTPCVAGTPLPRPLRFLLLLDFS